MPARRERAPRTRARLRVDFGTPGGRKKASFTADVGPRGFFLQTTAPPRHGTEIDVVLHLPDLDPVELHGVVRWGRVAPRYARSMQSGCGVELLDPPSEYLDYINQLH